VLFYGTIIAGTGPPTAAPLIFSWSLPPRQIFHQPRPVLMNKPTCKALHRRRFVNHTIVSVIFFPSFLTLLQQPIKKVDQQPNTCRAVRSGDRRSSCRITDQIGVRNGQSLLSLADSLQLYACSMAGCSPAAVVTWRARLLASSAPDPPPGQPHSTPLAADGHGRPPTAMAVLHLKKCLVMG
jgi:hypothetical protein